jgi:hypothetical protein
VISPASSGQLPGNISALLADGALPGLIGYGYGGEWMSGTVASRTRPGRATDILDELLLFTDRGNCAVWAHRADVVTGQALDARTLYGFDDEDTDRPNPAVQDCAAGPWSDSSDDLRVAVVARHGVFIWFLRWVWQSGAPAGAFGEGTDRRNLEAAAPMPPDDDPAGMTGCPRVIEHRADPASDEVTHFACALPWRHHEELNHYSLTEQWQHHSWDLAFVPVTGRDLDPITWWRLPRTATGVAVGGLATPDQLLDKWLRPDSRLMIQDLVQRGDTLYALAMVYPTNRNLEPVEPRQWLLTLDRVDQGASSIGETAVRSGLPAWDLDLVHLLPLRTPGGVAIEQQRLFISPDGRFLTVTTGHTAGGVFLIDAVVQQEPVVVWGLRLVGSDWYGWDAAQNSLNAKLGTSVGPGSDERAEGYPRWPIGFAAHLEEGQPAVIPTCQSAPFFEAGDDLFMVLDGDPITVWRVHSPTRRVAVQFVGGLAGRGDSRMRVALSSSDALFLLGDMGCVAITPDDCATEPDPTPGACAVLE